LFYRDGGYENGAKASILSIAGEVTKDGDQIFTCRVTVGEDRIQEDTLAYLKTFSVRSRPRS
jgi:hypothetical protein